MPSGSITWAQGMFWKFIPPPYTQLKPITLLKGVTPIGALRTGSNKPSETIQVIGRSRRGVPHRVDIDLGWADIEIINGREIRFKGGGLETDVGTRIPETTRGMDLGEGGFVGISRRRMPKKKPSRKKRRLTSEEYMTTLKGFRP